MKNKKQNIISQMFDVRPVNSAGGLDWEKIEKIVSTLVVKPKEKKPLNARVISGQTFYDIKKPDAISDEIRRFQKVIEADSQKITNATVPVYGESEGDVPVATIVVQKNRRAGFVPDIQAGSDSGYQAIQKEKNNEFVAEADLEFLRQKSRELMAEEARIDYFSELAPEGFAEFAVAEEKPRLKAGEKIAEIKNFFRDEKTYAPKPKKFALSFAGAACFIFILIFGAGFFYRSLSVKNSVLSTGGSAYASLARAQGEIMNKNFQASAVEFDEAYKNFSEISSQLDGLGGILVDASKYVPFLSKLSSGSHLAEAGKDISRIGVLSAGVIETLGQAKNPLSSGTESVSYLKILQDTSANAKEIASLLEDANQNLADVNVEDIPEEQRAKFSTIKNKLPEITAFAKGFADNGRIFADVLGGNGPRKYLFLFQNNQEMRATGGFIGTYGVMDISNGRIKKFFVDGIFNPDGQLIEKIVPPSPIQKISAAWSLHDSNWFPNFPTSAEEAMLFYEKTGGPTVDGVIAMTPSVMQKLLEITGPIEMPEYDVTIDKDNFVEKVQQEVEVDYDKELNQPKKILADLAPIMLDKIFNAGNFSDIAKAAKILDESLNEKQILIYSKNYDIEKMLSGLGWSGEILKTQKDYLSVINTNINGFKTDGVIQEKIEHQAEIQPDGTIVDTLTVTRHHNGGQSDYAWWNKVNADYMRVYVPKGSQLISAEGQTREFNSPPLDYNALGFKRDPLVQMEEDSIKIDEESGTRIYEDADKTVFANWVYVSPQETVTVKYKYLLPFKIEINDKNKPADTYSLLAQKQSGSVGSEFISNITFPETYNIRWKYPNELKMDGNNLKLETDLKTDKFIGAALVLK